MKKLFFLLISIFLGGCSINCDNGKLLIGTVYMISGREGAFVIRPAENQSVIVRACNLASGCEFLQDIVFSIYTDSNGRFTLPISGQLVEHDSTLAIGVADETDGVSWRLVNLKGDALDNIIIVKFDILKSSNGLTDILGCVNAFPTLFEGHVITVVGYYRGWDLLNEVQRGPPVTRSDWVVADTSSAIYVSALSKATPTGLKPYSLACTNVILEVCGIVRLTSNKQPYLEALCVRNK